MTALNDPSLWIDFTNVPPKWIPEVFARSKAAPLNLRYGHDSDYHIADQTSFIFDHVVEHPERIKTLEIHNKWHFFELLTKPAPFLDSLLIDAAVTFPPDFLGGVAPRLKFVSIRGGVLPPNASWLSNVTRLTCSRVHIKAPYLSKLTSLHLDRGWAALDARDEVVKRTSIDMLLSVLENMPLLQLLFFALPRQVDEVPSSRPTPVYLHHLRDITAHFYDCPTSATIFNHLRVDNVEKLHTIWPYQFNETAMVEPVCAFFEMCYHGDDLQYLLQTTSDLEMHRYIGTTTFHTPVLLFARFGPTDLAGVLNLLPRCVPRTFATRVGYLEKTTLPLGDCDTIEELHISTEYQRFTPFLFPAYTSPPYPSLRRLHLEYISFVPKAKRIPQLKRWITGRKSCTKVELLVMKGCRLSTKDIGLLRKAVPVVSD
ncbi:hypothetical protein EYR38_008785 [Pleurotus pulmonarius]|nr:hypothetical protein EYR38_008785 [Pleurotus pulmonarius]